MKTERIFCVIVRYLTARESKLVADLEKEFLSALNLLKTENNEMNHHNHHHAFHGLKPRGPFRSQY